MTVRSIILSLSRKQVARLIVNIPEFTGGYAISSIRHKGAASLVLFELSMAETAHRAILTLAYETQFDRSFIEAFQHLLQHDYITEQLTQDNVEIVGVGMSDSITKLLDLLKKSLEEK